MLTHIDKRAWLEEINQVWPSTRANAANDVAPRPLGLSFTLSSSGQVEWLRNRIVRLEPAQPQIKLDRSWLQSIKSLKNIVQPILHARKVLSAAATRFEIVEVDVGERAEDFICWSSLTHLATIVGRGVRVPQLPMVDAHDSLAATKELELVVSILQALLPPTVNRLCVKSVHAVEDMPDDLLMALFSAVQVSQNVDRVCVAMRRSPNELENVTRESVAQRVRWWKWAAYALFSRHANHRVNEVILHVDGFERQAYAAVKPILHAENPLATLFHTHFEEAFWVRASRFYLKNPHDDQVEDGESKIFDTTPRLVRVIDMIDDNGTQWSRVFLPGYGQAWVLDGEMTMDTIQHDSKLHLRPLSLELHGFSPENSAAIRWLLPLVAYDVRGLEIDECEDVEGAYDAVSFLRAVFRACPNLERLEAPVVHGDRYVLLDR